VRTVKVLFTERIINEFFFLDCRYKSVEADDMGISSCGSVHVLVSNSLFLRVLN